MNILTSMRARVDRLAAWQELDAEASRLPSLAMRLDDESVLDALAEVTALANDAGRLQAVLVGVAAQRSRREDGQGGLAAVHGHANPASLIQSITGGTKADATRQVRVGVSLLEGVGEIAALDDSAGGDVPARLWHEPLRVALLNGALTAAQHDAIRGGLGEPTVAGADSIDPWSVHEAWMLAAEGLLAEAAGMPVEELVKRARSARDLLDPAGAEDRYARRYDNREFRMWIDREGQHRARIAFDDEMGLWVRAMLDAALRPRRGGPRFITAEDRASAQDLCDDQRTNEQLSYDLLVDVLRTGSLASPAAVFGTRQPGVRMLIVKAAAAAAAAAAGAGAGAAAGAGAGQAERRDAFGRLVATGHAEDGGQALPGSVIDRNVCANGRREISLDGLGNPLDVGREKRLYTPTQTIALAARDGGCRWPGCARPASYCEAHHCDHFSEGGRTDIDRGILLCRHHHMLLHNRGWRITRRRHDDFLLHPPSDAPPIAMPTKAAWKYAWNPPPPPDRAGWRAA